MRKNGILILAGMAALALPSLGQQVADPFTQYEGRILDGRIQNMAANRDIFILHRVLESQSEVVESWLEGQLTLAWRKPFVSVDEPIILNGFRVAFTGAETQPSSKSVGLHVFDARTGARVHYSRVGILGRAGRFLAVSGDAILDLEDGSVIFGHVFNVRHVRFLATVGDKFLLLVSHAPDWNQRRPVLYDPVSKTDLWAGRTFPAETVEFLDKRIGSRPTSAYEGFPALLAENVSSRFGTSFKFMLLKADGQAVFFDRASFGLREPAPYATVDFSYVWSSPVGPRLVAGINTRHMGKIDGEKIVVAVFDPAGAKLAQAVIDPKAEQLAWTGLDPAGRLLAFVNKPGPRPRDFIVSFALPSLVRTQVESRYNAQVNSPPGLIDGKLFFWDQEPLFLPGSRIPPRAKTRRPLVAAVDSVSGGVTAYYPFDDSIWKLMSRLWTRIKLNLRIPSRKSSL